MNVLTHSNVPMRRLLWIFAIAALAALFYPAGGSAQELPQPTATVSQTGSNGPVVSLEVVKDKDGPVHKGNTFDVNVNVSNVENLSAFTYEIGFDPARVRPVPREGQSVEGTPFEGTPTGVSDDPLQNVLVQGDTGQFLANSPRNSVCTGPSVRSSASESVTGGCAGVSLPVCLGGPAGVSGSGTLATVVFESRGGDITQLALGSAVLTSDDAEPPCDPQGDLVPVKIDHETGPPVTVELAGGGGSSTLLIVVIVIVVAVVVAAGAGGYLFYRQRSATG